jgi:Helix-turn-helix of DDE superfamily endonuclease/DDE superfamily endonuclease
MLTYNALKDKAKEFLAATGLKVEEFARLLPAFESAYHALYPVDQTAEGKTRQRLPGGGTNGTLRTFEDKLLFILVYQKTYPLQTMHGLQFGLSQPQTHYWVHRLLPVLQRALADLKMTPEREGEHVATSELVNEHAPDLLIDGSERRRQRPQDAIKQQAHYSGKKKAHTDKNVILVNEHTGKVVYLSPTVEGKTHDKRATDEAEIVFPTSATLGKDTGFQGYEPKGVATSQPKKAQR